jgi:hypothetical protein
MKVWKLKICVSNVRKEMIQVTDQLVALQEGLGVSVRPVKSLQSYFLRMRMAGHAASIVQLIT